MHKSKPWLVEYAVDLSINTLSVFSTLSSVGVMLFVCLYFTHENTHIDNSLYWLGAMVVSFMGLLTALWADISNDNGKMFSAYFASLITLINQIVAIVLFLYFVYYNVEFNLISIFGVNL